VVVGVDGSSGSARALAWALREARDRQAPLRVLTAWTWSRPSGPVGVRSLPRPRPRDLARHTQDALVRAVVARFPGALPAMTTQLIQGDPASTLIEYSADGVLLVLGTRGLSGADGPDAVGSVADACLRHGTCPVVVVPDEPPPARLGPGPRDGAWRAATGLSPVVVGALGLL
jgi:nucleotide-binding universal stress UspA family protein